MKVQLRCHACAHAWTLQAEPRLLLELTCPGCALAAEPQAREDLSSSLEDALVQLGRLAPAFAVRVELDTAELPPAFEASA